MATCESAAVWITCRKPNTHVRVRLFCFPYAGTGASAFFAWPNRLPADVEVCAIQLPGREKRWQVPPCKRIARLVETLAARLSTTFAITT